MRRLLTIMLLPPIIALSSCIDSAAQRVRIPEKAVPATHAAPASASSPRPSPSQQVSAPLPTATPLPWAIVQALPTLPRSRLFFETKDAVLFILIDCTKPSGSCFSQPTQVSPEPGDSGGMEVSPDGRFVAIERVDPYGGRGLHSSIRLISVEDQRIWAVAQMGTRAPEWSPDGKRIAYIDYLGAGGQSSRICFSSLLQPYHCLPYLATYFGISSLAWSPDGRHIAYCEYPAGLDSCDLYVVDHDTSSRAFISHDARYPGWSPNGELLLFALVAGDQPRLMAARIQDCVDQQGTCAAELEPHPPGLSYTFSPDGAFAAYMTQGRLGVVETACVLDPPACAGSPSSLTSPDYRVLDFSWSPSGNHLAYAASNDSEAGIYIVDIHGSGTVQLHGIEPDYFPRLDWRPP